jgi:hypothetical protein
MSPPPRRAAVNNNRLSSGGAFMRIAAVATAVWFSVVALAGTDDAEAAFRLRLPIGKFAEGLFFDANVLDVSVVESNLRVWPEYDQPQDILQKAIYNGGRSNLTRQWIHGRPTKLGRGE